MESEFAYGDWIVNGRKCPIKTAESNISVEWDVELGELFDECARVMGHEDEGYMSREEARDVWKKLITLLENRTESQAYSYHQGQCEEMLSTARDVANELGWESIT